MDLGPHLGQGHGHPAHGTAPQGAVTTDHKVATGPAGQQAQHQAHSGTRIAAIQHRFRFLQAIESHPLDPHRLTRHDWAHLHPHRPQTGGGAEGILGGQQTLNEGFTLGDGPKQQGPMGN